MNNNKQQAKISFRKRNEGKQKSLELALTKKFLERAEFMSKWIATKTHLDMDSNKLNALYSQALCRDAPMQETPGPTVSKEKKERFATWVRKLVCYHLLLKNNTWQRVTNK
mmetsp:Transcript_32957/g.50416  ORF Transcript_32957/g.50416 Transcript_32957/m.50416 type:complete len:111 (+) Transcript_32957:1-333(+)